MNLTSKIVNGTVIAKVEGRVDTTNYSELETAIDKIISDGVNNIVLNCEGLSYISSSGLRVFLIFQKKLTAQAGLFHLCKMQPAIKEIFDISGFSTIFKIFDTEEKALENV